MQNHLKVVVTGEIDSGKSTLIGRFLYESGSLSCGVIEEIKNARRGLENNFEFAYLLDSLEEERKNKLTIDTTQVFCRNRRGSGFLFIDVPGHCQLLKNMLCGSSYADIAIIVLDAKKSMEEGTKRHINILKFLGIEDITFIFNKMDLLEFNKDVFDSLKERTVDFSKKIGIKPRYFIPICAKKGDNLLKKSSKMPWYKGKTLIEALNTLSKGLKKEKKYDFYFPIQDVYCIDGKRICVGNIISGRIKKAEKVQILPLNRESKVKKIIAFDRSRPSAMAPESIGLELTESGNLVRGEIVSKGKPPEVTTQILAKIFCVRPLNINENLRFRCLTQETPARISQIIGVWDTVNLEPKFKEGLLEETDFGEVVITTQNPVAVKRFKELNSLGRFVLRNNNRDIYAVGIIL